MFRIKQSTNGKYYFILQSTNGYVLVTSQDYASKAACYNGIEAVRKYASTEKIEDETL